MLTPKQEKFVQELIRNGGNQRRAYMATFNCERMKPETVDSKASRLMQSGGKVRARYEELRAEIAEQADKDAIADAVEVLKYFSRVMRREEKEQVVITIKKEETKWLPDEDGKIRKQTIKTEEPRIVEIDAKLSDANTAGIQLAKHYNLLAGEAEKGGGLLDEILSAVKGVDNG